MTGGVLFRTLPVLVNVRGRGTGARSGGERGLAVSAGYFWCWLDVGQLSLTQYTSVRSTPRRPDNKWNSFSLPADHRS